ncbi:MAG: dienelactone hydrolase family protein [bacterium]|nr:dienelactone hydrolase family protein [bacterium]
MCNLHGCGDDHANKPKPELSNNDRRNFIKGAIALPVATILAYPDLTKAAADTTKPVSVPMPNKGQGPQGMATGVIAIPATLPAPTVLLIHEWWGLNDHIKSMAAQFAAQGYIAVAIDLYGGKVATNGKDAQRYMGATDATLATSQLQTMANYLRSHKNSTGKLGTVGWCFGGGWSLNCSTSTPVDATIIYYGNVKKPAADLANLKGPVLGHFATKDKWINKAMVSGFESEMKKAGKTNLAVHWYEADHAFANPTSSRYDNKDAALAWQRTLDFYKKHLS